MNFYDISRLPSWIIPPIVKLAKLYYAMKYSLLGKHDNEHIKFSKYQKSRPLGTQPIICYAPFRSMYFGADGNITACCMNRDHTLGSYPEMTVKQVWEGEQNALLRKKLEKYDLTSGCHHCLQNIEAGNFDAVTARQFDTIPTNPRYPVMMEFELSNVCNLQCIMCTEIYSSAIHQKAANEKKTALIYDENFLLQLDEFLPHLKKAKFLGGEPFLIPIYYKIWERLIAVNPDCIINIQTNATILNDKIKSVLGSGNFMVNVSLDSFQKATYEKIRLTGNFETAMQNLNYFRQYSVQNNYPFTVAICPMQQNWEEMPDMVRQCNMMNVLVFFNTVWIPPECSLFHLSVRKLKNVLHHMVSAKLPRRTRIEKRNFVHFNGFINQLTDWIKQRELLVLSWEEGKRKFENISLHDMMIELKDILQKHYLAHTESTDDYEKIKRFLEMCEKEAPNYSDEFYFKRRVYEILQQPIEIIIGRLIFLGEEDITVFLDAIIKQSKEEESLVKASLDDFL